MLADRVAVIAKGAIVATGTPDSIGGRDTGTATIRFVLPEKTTSVSDLGLSQSELTIRPVDGRSMIEIETESPTAVLHSLTSWAVANGTALEGLEVARPSLEDVYLSLTAEDAQ